MNIKPLDPQMIDLIFTSNLLPNSIKSIKVIDHIYMFRQREETILDLLNTRNVIESHTIKNDQTKMV